MCINVHLMALDINPIALRNAKVVYNFGLSKRNRVYKLRQNLCLDFTQIKSSYATSSIEEGYIL